MSSESEEGEECDTCECEPCECCDICECFPCECDDDDSIDDDDAAAIVYKPKTLELSQITETQNKMVEDLASLLNLPFDKALVLLRCYKWSVGFASEKYMEDSERALKNAGVMLTTTPMPDLAGFTCSVCYDDEVPLADILALDCGHPFCKDCWQFEIKTKVSENRLNISCMHRKCRVRVTPEFLKSVLPPAEFPTYNKYITFQAKNFVNESKGLKFCTSDKGCEKVFKYDGLATDPVGLHCECHFDGCWACSLEDHKPIACASAKEFIKLTEDNDGSAVLDFIKANCRQCPGCDVPIMKNQGCNHMTCRKPMGCGHEFCWICLGPWSEHGTNYYSCNKFGVGISNEHQLPGEILKMTGQTNDVEEVSLKHDWFLFHVQRFDNHGRSKEFAIRDLEKAQEKADAFHDATQGWSGDFIIDGMALIVKCRHILRWSYAYGHQCGKDHPTRDLFVHQQTMLEAWTEALNHLLEQSAEEIAKNPQELKDKIASCRNFFENMVAGWESGQ